MNCTLRLLSLPTGKSVGPKARVNALEKRKQLDAGIGHPACHLDISVVTLRMPNNTDIITKHPTPDISLSYLNFFQ